MIGSLLYTHRLYLRRCNIMHFRAIDSSNRAEVNRFITEHWYSTDMVISGEIVDMTTVDGFAAYDGDAIIGLITYRIDPTGCEITSLDSIREHQGIGTMLIAAVVEQAKQRGCGRIKVITTNDNVDAMRFYQKRGFDMVRLHYNALDHSRRLKPSIPLEGNYGIPLKHEIEFEMRLTD